MSNSHPHVARSSTTCAARRQRRLNDSPSALARLLLPLVGVAVVLGALGASSARLRRTELPSPREDLGGRASPTSLEPFAKRGEMDQGILRFTWYSLVLRRQGLRARAAHRHAARLLARPVEAVHARRSIRSSRSCARSRRWRGCRSGLVLFQKLGAGGALHHRHLRDVADGAEHRGRRARDPAGLPERRAVLKLSRDARRSSRSCCPRRCRTCSPASG